MGLPLRSVSLLFLLPLMGLSPGPARAAALCDASPTVAEDIRAGAPGSGISEPVDVNGTLYFAADDGASGRELWKSNGTAGGTALVRDIRSGAPSSNPTALTAVGSTLYFLVPGATQGVELWKSDGSFMGTELLKAFPNMASVSGAELTAVGNTLYFVAEQVSGDAELWKSNGSAATTVPVMDIYPGTTGSFPSLLTAVGNQLYFRANEPSGGYELWKSDATGTAQVKDVVPGPLGSTPRGLTAVGQLLYFFASSETGNTTLWRSNGTALGTVLVRDFGDAAGVTLQFPTAAGNTLFFQLDIPAYGAELWRSDGTPQGTVLVKDIQPGAAPSSPRELTAVGGTLFFVANDGVHGAELWKSDGSAAGTRLVRDIIPGSGNPDFGQLAAGPGILLLEVDDLQSGGEPWRSNGTLEGTYPLADLVPGASASAPREFRYSGANLFFVATEASQGEELFAVPLKQVDCAPPVFNCPPPNTTVEIEALSSQGTQVDYPPLGAVDDALFGLGVYFNPAPGMLPLGITNVTAFARDLVGNETQCGFKIAVVDKTGPLLLCPAEVEQEATGPNGVKPTFFVVASDAVTPASQLPVVYQPPLGGDFAVGVTDFKATVTDAAGNPSDCFFKLKVTDTTPPQLRCPADVFQVATSEAALSVPYTVEARDAVTLSPELIYSRPPGTPFPLGETAVSVQARDAAGNPAQCSFKVRVVDPQGPTISCPETQYAEVSGGQGAVVNFSEAVAADNLGEATIVYSHAPGSTFPEGETEVTATASDRGGQTASCTFTVVVERGLGGGTEDGTSCQAGPWSGGLGWLLLVLIPAWARRRAGGQGR
jgi:ELWxxDGT repeat protein